MFKPVKVPARFRANQCQGVALLEEEPEPAAKICLEEAVVMPITVKESDLWKRVTSFMEGNCETGQHGEDVGI